MSSAAPATPATTAAAPTTAGQPAQAPQQKKHHGSGSAQSGSGAVTIVGSHYKIGRKIGEGSFGVIYEGVSLLNDTPVAIKFEPRKSDAPQLRDEYRTYKLLAGSVGIPNVYYFGQEGLHNILVIDLLGHSLEDLFDMCGRKFPIKTAAMAAKQMITRVQAVHEKNLIYRDIKPDNFLVGRGPSKQNMIYMVDFGMAKQYRDPKTKQHIPYRERKSLSGTARYMSINTHLGREQSRRDDLEALGHVFMYFLRGSLPWQGLKAATNKQKYEKIGEKKQQTSIKELCEGFPDEFAQYLTYARKLGFEETPDYDYLRGLMQKVLQRDCENGDDGVFAWMLLDKDKLNKKGEEAPSPVSKLGASQARIAGSNADMKGTETKELKSSTHHSRGQLASSPSGHQQNQHEGDKGAQGHAGNNSRQPQKTVTGGFQSKGNVSNMHIQNSRHDAADAGDGNGAQKFKLWFLKTFCCTSS